MPVEPLRVEPVSDDDAKWKRDVARVLADLVIASNANESAISTVQGQVS